MVFWIVKARRGPVRLRGVATQKITI